MPGWRGGWGHHQGEKCREEKYPPDKSKTKRGVFSQSDTAKLLPWVMNHNLIIHHHSRISMPDSWWFGEHAWKRCFAPLMYLLIGTILIQKPQLQKSDCSIHFEEPRKVRNIQCSIPKIRLWSLYLFGGVLLHGVIGSFYDGYISMYINMCAYVLFVGDAFLIFFISWQKHVQTWHVQPPQTASANSAMLAEPSAWRKPEKPRQGRNLSKPVKKNEAKTSPKELISPKKNMMIKHEPIISIWIISCFRLKSVLKQWNHGHDCPPGNRIDGAAIARACH